MKLYDRKETTPLRFYKFFMYVYLPVAAFGALYSIVSYIFMNNLNIFKYEGWYIWLLISISIALIILYVFLFIGLLGWKKYTFALFIALLASCLVTGAVNIYYFFAVFDTSSAFSYFDNFQYAGMPAGFTAYFTSIMESSVKMSIIFATIVSVALNTLVFFYFHKRKRLFDGIPYKIPPKSTPNYPLQPYYPQQPYYPPQSNYQQQYNPQPYNPQPYKPQPYNPQQQYYQQQYYPPQNYQYAPPPCCPACGAPRPSPEQQVCPNCGKRYDSTPL